MKEGHHEVKKKPGTSQRNGLCLLSRICVQSPFQCSRRKWAVVDKESRRESLESFRMSCGPFPIPYHGQNASRLILFSVFGLGRNPILN